MTGSVFLWSSVLLASAFCLSACQSSRTVAEAPAAAHRYSFDGPSTGHILDDVDDSDVTHASSTAATNRSHLGAGAQ